MGDHRFFKPKRRSLFFQTFDSELHKLSDLILRHGPHRIRFPKNSSLQMLIRKMLQGLSRVTKLHRVTFFCSEIDEKRTQRVVLLRDLPYAPAAMTAVSFWN